MYYSNYNSAKENVDLLDFNMFKQLGKYDTNKNAF